LRDPVLRRPFGRISAHPSGCADVYLAHRVRPAERGVWQISQTDGKPPDLWPAASGSLGHPTIS
jgi:hypothetical protein